MFKEFEKCTYPYSSLTSPEIAELASKKKQKLLTLKLKDLFIDDAYLKNLFEEYDPGAGDSSLYLLGRVMRSCIWITMWQTS